jgi:hypothetical protein
LAIYDCGQTEGKSFARRFRRLTPNPLKIFYRRNPRNLRVLLYRCESVATVPLLAGVSASWRLGVKFIPFDGIKKTAPKSGSLKTKST